MPELQRQLGLARAAMRTALQLAGAARRANIRGEPDENARLLAELCAHLQRHVEGGADDDGESTDV